MLQHFHYRLHNLAYYFIRGFHMVIYEFGLSKGKNIEESKFSRISYSCKACRDVYQDFAIFLIIFCIIGRKLETFCKIFGSYRLCSSQA